MNLLVTMLSRCWRAVQGPCGGSRATVSRSRRQQLSLEFLEDRNVPSRLTDSLYIADLGDHTVKQFNATTGAYLDTFVPAASGGLVSPVGIDFGPGHNLLVGDQGPNTSPGVIVYDGRTGAPLRDLVPGSNPNGPFSPRGIVRGPMHQLFVADIGDFGKSGLHPGLVAVYDDRTGEFIRDLQAPGFASDFNPRGVVIGPDGDLYVSTREHGATSGDIFKFDPRTGAFDGLFIASTAENDLNAPGVPAFGPDGNLYVPSFPANSNDTNKILEFNGETGAYIGKIDLNQPGQPSNPVQQVMFGPDGRLFAPIGGIGPDAGEVRRYDVSTGAFDVFIPPHAQGGQLVNPWYLTFGHTNPFTFAYRQGDFESDHEHDSEDSAEVGKMIPDAAEINADFSNFLTQAAPGRQFAEGNFVSDPDSQNVSLPDVTQAALPSLPQAQSGRSASSQEAAKDWLFADLGTHSFADEWNPALSNANG